MRFGAQIYNPLTFDDFAIKADSIGTIERKIMAMSFDHLERPMDFIPKRQGSWDRSGGNADSRPIKPGGELVLAKLKGPGRIVH